MEKTKIKISSIVENQLPLFVREEYPLATQLLTEYYRSLEFKGSSYDILQNIEQYVKVNNLTNLVESTELTENINSENNSINVVSTEGFPNNYGLIYIDNEIILYKSKTTTSFDECVRGFSGIVEFSVGNTEELLFKSTEAQDHSINGIVVNLSSLFLKEFFIKVKKQFLPGFDNRDLYEGLNQEIFLKQSRDFYTSKGTNRSFEILFRVLYGKDVDVLLPRDYLIKPSDAQYRVTRNIVVEPINDADIEELRNKTIFQNQYNDIPKSFGTVTDIQKITRNNKEYYILKLDYDFDKDIIVSGSIFGELKVHQKTKIIDNVALDSTVISVDSTLGFPDSGELLINNSLIKYSGKTVNQFLNCTGINQSFEAGTEVNTNTYAYGYSASKNEIKFRINGVLSSVNLPEGSLKYEKNDIGKIITLGYNKNNLKDNNWVFNKTIKCNVLRFTNDGSFKYTIETYDNNGIYEGDDVEIDYLDSLSGQRNKTIISGSNVRIPNGSAPGKSFQIIASGLNISNIFSIKKIVSKFSNKFLTDILNVYKDTNNDDLYITSSSLPFYGSNPTLNIQDFKLNLSGSFVGAGQTLTLVNPGQSHGFITGDAVVYGIGNTNETLGIQSGVYYVKKINDTQIKLSKSRSDINAGIFVSVASTVLSVSSDNTLSLLSFSKNNNKPSEVDSQKIVRLLSNPLNGDKNYSTLPGTVGILVNGVEILNYKSDDYIYYGPIKSIEVLSPGSNYDIINPPALKVSSSTNSAVETYCAVEGQLEKINIIDPGFDYLDTPVISISGGGGFGANATVKMIDYDHFVDLNSSSSNGNISLGENIIGFSTYHKFRDGELVVYKTGGSQSIGGLIPNSKYYVHVVNDLKIKLHSNYKDSINGINPINITSYGVGNHRFESTIRKKKVNSIIVTDKGSGYKNEKLVVPSSGINTSSNIISTKSNSYLDGEVIYYYGGDTNVEGLSTGSYIITKVDNSSFKLSNIGIGSTPKDFYYKTKQYVDFKSTGSGNHIFNYEPIEVKISGKVGISTISNVDVSAKIQPVFRGKIKSVFVSEGGVGYGSSEIVNYNKQPEYTLTAGSGAILSPIISNGKIVNIVINDGGKDYNSPPDLIIRGFGIGANLTPIIKNGKIVEVKIINGGINYEQKNTSIEVISPGTGCNLKFYPQVWTINNFSRLLNTKKIASDDGVIYKGKNKNYGIQYTHSYPPRSLRKKIFAQNIEDGILKFKSDYQNDFDVKKYHSPLLGWSYDGNPIYGPYGYDSPSNKSIRQITSGYSNPIDNQPNRPDKKIFPAGFFVEDYIFDNSGDLDEHNGRFCVTPEYPEGTYAYFMTLNTVISNSGVFAGEKEPKFPYIIGNSYKSKPIEFNFRIESNQDDFDINSNRLVRNTNPYNTLNKNSKYEYIFNLDDLKSYNIKVKNTKRGKVDSVKIISGGENYKVGDKLIFNSQNQRNNDVVAKVQYIKGKTVTGISQSISYIDDVEFYPSLQKNRIIGFSSQPHNLRDADYISIDSLNYYDPSLEGSFNVGIKSDLFVLTVGVGDTSITGIVTYFSVSGILDFPNVRENDILTINYEDVKVLNVDKENSRIRVLREQNSTVSSAHSAFSTLYEKSRKFFIDLDNDIQNKEYKINRQIYFNPAESLGIGSFVGFGHTIFFENPGPAGFSSIVIPEKTIYLKNHKLETGDELIYNTNSGIGISVYNGTQRLQLNDNSKVYVAKISNDLIGISTVKVGLGTTGEFVGISKTTSTLFFVGYGEGNYHSFTTNYDNISKLNITKNTITVSLGSTHNLRVNDSITINSIAGFSTSISISYNDYHRRLIVNPRYFSSVDIENNLITVQNHNYVTGEKLIHTSSVPSGGLKNQGIYYAIVYDKNRIKLSDSYYGATNNEKLVVGITSSSFGTLSQVNPKIEVLKYQNIVFDLSSDTLSQPSTGVGRTSSFDFKLYLDSNFNSEYSPVDSEGISKIRKIGNIGVDSNARIEFKLDSEFPNSIYYNLIPISELSVKNELQIDTEVLENNKIKLSNSKINGNKIISGISSNKFNFESDTIFEDLSLENNQINYYTNSLSESGAIENIKVLSSGSSYKKLPSIEGVSSLNGSGAILIPESETIGGISSCIIPDIGYNYSTDKTLKPFVRFPTIVRLEPLSTFKSIKIISPGLNYITEPNLIVIDGFTNEVVKDVYLEYDLQNNDVKIIKNTNGLYNVTPRIIPINNSNGLGISSISYNSLSKIVTVFFTKQFSDPGTLPFFIGDKVFIEGISVLDSSSRGYNSKNYNYNTFNVVGVHTNLGGSGSSLQYSLSDYLNNSENPGIFDIDNSSGRIISETSFPKFEINLTKNNFIPGESVESDDGMSGIALKWDDKNEYLTVETIDDFKINSLIVGRSSKSQAFIKEIFSYETSCVIDSSSIVNSGWNKETGFLNNNLQRMQDSDYYQYFSYSLRSEVPIQEWNDAVSNLNHTLGFKKFSDLSVNSNIQNSGISTDQNNGILSALSDLNSIVDVDCISDYDLVSENNFYVEETLTSDEIIFNSSILQDYSESVGNKVLTIDDISKDFNTSSSRTFVTSFNI